MSDDIVKILAFGAHPDDVEMSCAGTLMKQAEQGYSFGIIDLTRGELGTTGTSEIRKAEAINACKITGAKFRENLNFRDGFFINDEQHQLEVIKMIRKYKPEIIFANAINDRHPDHGKGAALIKDAAFLSGLKKIKTIVAGHEQDEWRPKAVYHYIQDKDLQPDFLIDVSSVFEKKMESILAFKSQFFNSESREPKTYISDPDFLDSLTGRMRLWGKIIGVKYAEGFTVNKIIGVNDIFNLR